MRNLEQDLDRLTAPPPKASEVKRLSPEEIQLLVQGGEITPIEQIPKRHPWSPENEPLTWGCQRGRYEH